MHRLTKREEIRARKRTSQIRERSEGGRMEGGEERVGGKGGRKGGERSKPQKCLTQWTVLCSLTLCLPSLPPSSPSLPPLSLPSVPPSIPPSLLDDTSLRAPRRVTINWWARPFERGSTLSFAFLPPSLPPPFIPPSMYICKLTLPLLDSHVFLVAGRRAGYKEAGWTWNRYSYLSLI